VFGAALLLSGCMQSAHNQSTTFLDRYAELNPTLAHFRECHGFSCAESSSVSLTAREWQRVTAVFKPQVNNAAAERRRIAQAVMVMRRLVGTKTGTAVHQWTHSNTDILPNLGDPTQLDCIDEAVNTWTYMTMMERARLFRFHRVAQLSNSGNLHDPRNTAVIQQNDGDYFAVDPAVVDFNVPPPVIPLASWLTDWPPKLAATQARAQAAR
jgi:hypothetical protein